MTPGNPKFDFTKEVRHYLDKALIITTDIQKLTAGGKDWRNVAVNLGYQRSRSDYVLHLEQDFLFGDTFMEDLLLKGVDYDLVSENEGGRLHPCCMLVKTSPARMTSMDFSAYPPVGDHFKKFTDEITKDGNWATLQRLEIEDFHHISGFTHNYRLVENFHRKDWFYTYNLFGVQLEDQPEEWREFCQSKLDLIKDGKVDVKVRGFFEDFL